MAVDTAQKRRSMISFSDFQFAERVSEATNFDSAEDRGQSIFLYSGVAPSSSGGSGNADNKFWWFRRRHR